MFELNKEQFGAFLTEQRKKKGYTQKDLAQRLFVSDKAVSKWERGMSMPDVSLLIPLADILDVSVTELLEGRQIEKSVELDTSQVEDLVKRVLTISDETPEKVKRQRMKHGLIFGGCLFVVLFEVVILHLLGYTLHQFVENSLFVLELLSVIFGVYFWFFVKEKLPTYYDENRICVYSDGAFRMNIPGIHFNNSNWPYIIRVGRLWTVLTAIIYPVFGPVMNWYVPDFWKMAGLQITLIMFLGGLFIPLYVVGKKYE